MRALRLALAQMNPTVGDTDGNADIMLGLIERGVDHPNLVILHYQQAWSELFAFVTSL